MVFRSERILLTGSGGFTGRPLRARLRQNGHDIYGLARTAAEGGELHGDLCDLDWVKRAVAEVSPTVVVHLAGIATPLHGNVGEIYSVNVAGTANLLTALAELPARPRLVVVASSATVYAPPFDDRALAEDAPLLPQNHYGASKRALEDVARLYAERLPMVVTRPFNYTGPGQSTIYLVPKIVDHFVKRAREIRLGNLDLYRDFSDVRRVVEVYSRLVSQPVEPATINICSGRAVHLRSIVTLLQEISGHSIDVIEDPALMRRNEPRTITGSTVRLQATVGDVPNPELRETLRAMYDSGH